MKKLITIILILITSYSVTSQNNDFESLNKIVKNNQVSFTLQMFDILRNCKVISENFKDESKPVLINYKRNSSLSDDYWMALVSFNSAKFIFDNNNSLFKNNLSVKTYEYLEKMLSEDWDDTITGNNIVGYKMNMVFKIILYHSEKSKIEKEYRLLLDKKEIDMNIYKPN